MQKFKAQSSQNSAYLGIPYLAQFTILTKITKICKNRIFRQCTPRIFRQCS